MWKLHALSILRGIFRHLIHTFAIQNNMWTQTDIYILCIQTEKMEIL